MTETVLGTMKLASLLSRLGKPGKLGVRGQSKDGVEEEHTVYLYRGGQGGFGFAVCCEVEDEEWQCGGGGKDGVVVDEVVRGGPAEGRLKKGDKIARVGDTWLEGMKYGKAIQVLLVLLLLLGPAPAPAPAPAPVLLLLLPLHLFLALVPATFLSSSGVEQRHSLRQLG